MRLGIRFALALLLTTIQFLAASAEGPPTAKVLQELIPFSSDEGLARLARSTAKVDFPALANQFEAQSNPAFCGPTSAAIVLMPCTAVIPICRAIGAAFMKET